VIATLDKQSCSPGLAAVVDSAWPLLLHTMSADAADADAADPQKLTRATVLQACNDALSSISKVVQQPEFEYNTEWAADRHGSTAAGHEGWMQPAGEVLLEFAPGLERFRSRVMDAAIQQEVDEVRLSFTALML
jgi:hypothetical protein